VNDRSGRGPTGLHALSRELEELRDELASSRGTGPADRELQTLGQEIEEIQAHLRRLAEAHAPNGPID
jgi:hypothetical protein